MSRSRVSAIVWASVLIALATSGCGTDPVPGSNGSAKAELGETFVDFGQVDCGSTQTKEISVRNVGSAILTFAASTSTERFSVTPAEGSLDPGEDATLTVTAQFPNSAEAGAVEEGVLAVTTNETDGDALSVSLKAESKGVTLALEPTAAAWDDVFLATNAQAVPLRLFNGGNVDATIAVVQPEDEQFWVDWAGAPSLVTVPAGGRFDGLQAKFSPTTLGQSNTAAVLNASQAACGESIGAIPMTGEGVNWPAETVVFQPSKLDFGKVDCGTTAPPRTVTFTNDGELDYVLSARLERGEQSPYSIEIQPRSGVVVAGGELTITVTPAGIPQTSSVSPGVYNDTLIVTTNVPDEELHEIEIQQTARGAIFAIAATKLNFGSVVVGATGSAQFSVSNQGNAPGKLSFEIDALDPFFLPTTVIAGGSSTLVKGDFTPPSVSSYNSGATLHVDETTVLCEPLPHAEMELEGFGISGSVVSVSTPSLTFGSGGMVDCGEQATSETFHIQSYSKETLSISYELGRGADSPFAVAGIETLGDNGKVKVTVTPKPIPQVASTRPDAFGDTLLIRIVGASIEESYVVSLFQTARGAVFSFVPESLSLKNTGLFASAQTKSFSVRNDGNILAPFQLSIGGEHPKPFTVTPDSATVSVGASTKGSVTFAARTGAGKKAEVVLTTSGATCGPMPVLMPLTGN